MELNNRNGQQFLAAITKISQNIEPLVAELKRANDLKEAELKLKGDGTNDN